MYDLVTAGLGTSLAMNPNRDISQPSVRPAATWRWGTRPRYSLGPPPFWWRFAAWAAGLSPDKSRVRRLVLLGGACLLLACLGCLVVWETAGPEVRWGLGIGAASLLALTVWAASAAEGEIRRQREARQAVEERIEASSRSEESTRTLLVAADKELAAFVYSVSHDLRAPLRGIDGWSKALQEDYGDQLDARAMEYLGRVRSEAKRMTGQIDGILRLSRIAATEMRSGAVDLSALADAVASRLRQDSPERDLEFVVARGLAASGDARLLEIAIASLLDNAVKFTRPRPHARIEFGRQDSPTGQVFFIRDNGVGFDMAHAGMLFGAFQRLHKASEFPGTGMGLAVAQRAIRRHGGRMWADAQPDRGAAFYFTVGGALCDAQAGLP